MFTYRVRLYLLGALAAAINSAVSALTLVLVDPKDFNPFAGAEWHALASVTIANMVVGFLLYLKQHPLPDPNKDIDAAAAGQKLVTQITDKLTGTGDGPKP